MLNRLWLKPARAPDKGSCRELIHVLGVVILQNPISSKADTSKYIFPNGFYGSSEKQENICVWEGNACAFFATVPSHELQFSAKN